MKLTNSSFFSTCLLVGLALMGGANNARAWWNTEWTLRKAITVDATAATGASITDPIGASAVLVRLHDGNFQFPLAKEDASDLRFVAADDKTLLPYHVEKYDPVLNEAFVWVKVPVLKPGAQTKFWLYYGNAGPKAVKIEDPRGTYDADTTLVYHFSQGGQPAYDFSGGGNNAQNAGIASEGSLIGGGLRLDGKTLVGLPDAPAIVWTEGSAMTWSAWIKPSALQSNAVLFSRWDGSKAFAIGLDNGMPFVEVTNASGTGRSRAGTPVAANTWHHVAVVASGAVITLYLDGEAYGTLSTPLPGLGAGAHLGGDGPIGSVGSSVERTNFIGEFDELEISKVARTPGFIKLAAFSQAGGDQAAKLLVLGQDEQPADPLAWLKGGYFGVIVGSLTLDGWVVIGLLGVMSIISWFVMVNKIGYLNGVSRGNGLFLEKWEHIANDLTVLDGDLDKLKTLGGNIDEAALEAMRNSSVFRIYHIGAEEIRKRVAMGRSGGKVLSARSIQAIRASLDGGLVRETQRINNLVVLLTICISGGPFLGLLGTVVGVMITFAAVAAAGDVNVNAIAPGIAAALLATVAGLAVAIPSLFGYNYIISRVKNATSDMHVFIDEFVTKMAEFYSEESHKERALTRAPFAPIER